MNLQNVIDTLNLSVLTDAKDFTGIQPGGGYCPDLLSCVMAGAKPGDLWVTLQAHINVVAVAALTDACAVIITEGAQPEQAVIEKARSQGVTLLGTAANSYTVTGRLWELGLK